MSFPTRFLAAAALLLATTPLFAQTCATPKLVNGLDMALPCLQYAGQNYALTLENVSANPLTWRFSGALTPTTCTPATDSCATVGNDLSIGIRQLDLAGARYRAELTPAPQLGSLIWQYKSHSPEITNTVLTPTAVAEIRSYMAQLVADKTIPGAVIGIAEGSNLTVIDAYGVADAATGKAMTIDDMLHIGSTNKAITSFALATLVDDGVLSWDTRVHDIYPEFNLRNSAYASRITLRQLLDMTSGLPREADFYYSEPARKMLDGLGNVPLVGAPGGAYLYSNVSYSVAGYLGALARIEKTRPLTDADLDSVHSGYNALLQDKVLNPIGMTSSYLSVTDARATGRMAKSHVLKNGIWTVTASQDPLIDNSAPSGGLKATVTDMLRYIVTDMQGGVTPSGTRIATAANVTERQKPSTGQSAANNYGLGLNIGTAANGLEHISHDGTFDNFNSVMGWFPGKQVAFVLLTNGESSPIFDLTGSGFINRLAEIIK